MRALRRTREEGAAQLTGGLLTLILCCAAVVVCCMTAQLQHCQTLRPSSAVTRHLL
jgi:hypothetical protein